eukprot:NODE_22722_length_697_cov_3.182456.p1 GENE.NODE_22722_length_697_cov_3.182456~~NODE_22722_length_697_cov_3.182456.p1  ORF type:complete len:98 (+),score=3.59 NODE_22722_length_697_cov_3.182456:77-370(+)
MPEHAQHLLIPCCSSMCATKLAHDCTVCIDVDQLHALISNRLSVLVVVSDEQHYCIYANGHSLTEFRPAPHWNFCESTYENAGYDRAPSESSGNQHH